MIHSDAGVGKSGVLYELAEKLAAGDGICLPVRLDRQLLKGNSTKFGKEECDLPGSPAKCLRPYQQEKYNVLIIDQLDAIRLTNKHSPSAMTLFEELVEEALAIPNCRVVVACRTFDLDDNQLIKSWVNQRKVQKKPIQFLTVRNIQDAVQKLGGDYSQFSESQIQFLKVPQNLYLWSKARREEDFVYDFDNPTDLFRQYWVWVDTNLENYNVASGDMKRLLTAIVERMDSTGKLAYPIHLAQQESRRALEVLLTLNVLRKASSTELIFAHQSQFDYLSAERVAALIRDNELTLQDWLDQKGQSLFCREELRLVLSNLRDTANEKYGVYIKYLVASPKVRFHLQLLGFGFLGGVREPTDEEADLVKSLIENKAIRSHVINDVILRRPVWVQKFVERGFMDTMHESPDSWVSNSAYLAHSSVAEDLPDSFISLVSKNLESGKPWPERLRDFAFRGNETTEPTALFKLRLTVLDRIKQLPKYIDWEKLEPGKEERFFELLRRFVKRYGQAVASGLKDPPPPVDSIFVRKANEIVAIAKREAETAWKLSYCCIRYLLRLQRLVSEDRVQEKLDFSSSYRFDGEIEKLIAFVAKVFVAAGRVLLKESFPRFSKFNAIASQHPAALIQRSLILIWQEAEDSKAEDAINWLASEPELRFAVGDAEQSSRYAPAEGLIKRLAHKCSASVLDQLQQKIGSYKDLLAFEDYKRYLKNKYYREYFDFCNEVGLAHYVLFSAIPKDSRSVTAKRRVDEGEEKFGGLPTPRRSPTGGSVQSSIPQDRLKFVSDKQWLEIVQGDWSKRGDKWNECGIVREASHEQFSQIIGVQAKREPSRFAELALKLPEGKGDCYLSQILWNLQKTEPPKDKDGKELDGWQSLSHSQIIALLRRVGFHATNDFGRGFCNLITSYEDVEWPADILKTLRQYAVEYPDPIEESHAISSTQNVMGEKVSLLEYDGWAINSVRPLAARAIGYLLFERHDFFTEFESTIEELVVDDSPIVRVGAISACLPILNFDRDKAVLLFLRACEFQDEQRRNGILFSRNTNSFLQYALHSHAEQLGPIILAMKNSSWPKLQKTGSQWIVSEWLRYGRFAKEVESCIAGNVEHRKGAASAVANIWNQVSDPVRRNAKRKRYFNWLWHSLGWWDRHSAFDMARKLFDAPEKEVGQLISEMFRDVSIFENRWFASLAKCFLKSNSVSHSLDDLTSGLKDRQTGILDSATILFSICERVSQLKGDPEQQMPDYSMAEHHLPELLLRLYHQSTEAKDRSLSGKCLDAWDDLLRANFGNTRFQLTQIEATN